MEPREVYNKNIANTIIKNLEKRQMEGYYFPTAKEAVTKTSSFLKKGTTVGFGGSMTLSETGMMDFLQNNSDIILYDRSKSKTKEEVRQIYQQSLNADYYFMSSNAITTDGKLVNIDGTGNRLAALIYGPENVILLVGMNKVTLNEKEAISRVRNVASPANSNRLNHKTPCAKTGVCTDCLSPECICSQTVITRRSAVKGRIKVILIGESFGY